MHIVTDPDPVQIRSGDQHPKTPLPTQKLAATNKSTYFRPATPTQEIGEVSCKNIDLHKLQLIKEDRKVRGADASLQLAKPRIAPRRPNNQGSCKGTLTCRSPRRNKGKAETQERRGYHPVQIRSRDRHSKNSTPIQQPETTNTSTHYRPTSFRQKIGEQTAKTSIYTLGSLEGRIKKGEVKTHHSRSESQGQYHTDPTREIAAEKG